MAAEGKEAISESRWNYRLVVYFAPLEEQRDALGKQIDRLLPAARERGLRLVSLGVTSVGSELSLFLFEAEKALWRERLDVVGAAGVFFLIGKDGGVTARQRGAPELQRFFELIAMMPMRRAELRRERGRESL